MSRVSVAERTRCPCSGAWPYRRADQPRYDAPDRRLAVLVRQGRPRRDRAAGPAHGRLDARGRDLCRPLRVRRQGHCLRFALAVRDGGAVRGLGGLAAGLRVAATPACRRDRHHPRQCPRTGRRVDRAQQRAGPDRLAPRRGGAAGHLLAQPGAAGARRRRRAILSPLPAQPGAAGAPPAAHRIAGARRRARLQAAIALRGAVHGAPAAPHPRRRQAPRRGARSASCPTEPPSAAIPAR